MIDSLPPYYMMIIRKGPTIVAKLVSGCKKLHDNILQLAIVLSSLKPLLSTNNAKSPNVWSMSIP